MRTTLSWQCYRVVDRLPYVTLSYDDAPHALFGAHMVPLFSSPLKHGRFFAERDRRTTCFLVRRFSHCATTITTTKDFIIGPKQEIMRLESSRTRRTPRLLSEPQVEASIVKKKAKTARKPKAALPPASNAGPVGNSAIKKAASATPVALEPYTVVYKVVWRGGDL